MLHEFVVNLVDLLSVYKAPDVGTERQSQYFYNYDKQLKQEVRPDGAVVNYTYEVNPGRLLQVQSGSQFVAQSFDPSTGNLLSKSSSDGVISTYGYDGSLITAKNYSGLFNLSISKTFKSPGLLTAQEIVGGQSISYAYDADELLIQAGSLTILRDSLTPRVNQTQVDSVLTSFGYSSLGELSSISASANGAPVLGHQFGRDNLGRITQDSVSGIISRSISYNYDLLGRLAAVSYGNVLQSSFTYDGNGNRLSETSPAGTTSGTYDTQDKLLTWGSFDYSYDNKGTLVQKKNRTTGDVTNFTYDVFGQLKKVSSGATMIEYLTDGEGRRIGRKKNGQLTGFFAYNPNGQLVAELNADGSVRSRFVFGASSTVPDYMTTNGQVYKFIANQVGSVEAVINSGTGAVVQKIDYSPFGKVLSDSNPGFQPFGFAGGLYDSETKLVRFGARDYDAETGRWTSKDPSLFAGGMNLYGYTNNDPVNFIDPNGKNPLLAAIAIGAGVGAFANLAGSYFAGTLTSDNAVATAVIGAAGGAAAVLTAGTAALATATTLTGLFTAELSSGLVATAAGAGIDVGLTLLFNPPAAPAPSGPPAKRSCP